MLMFRIVGENCIVIFYVGFSNMRGATAGTAQPLREAETKPHEATYLSYYSFFSKREE